MLDKLIDQIYNLGFSEDCCIFPFIYDGVSYNECTTEGEGGLWCATEVYDDGNWKAWKICDETCSGKFYARTHSNSLIFLLHLKLLNYLRILGQYFQFPFLTPNQNFDFINFST